MQARLFRTRLGHAALATAPFVAVLAYFHIAAIYDRHFFDSGVTLPYNVCRGVFAVYLFAAICGPGDAVLAALRGGGFSAMPPLARLAAAFFCGAALWHVLLLALGFLDLYRYPVAVALAVAAVGLSALRLSSTLGEIGRQARAALAAAPRPAAAAILPAAAIVAAVVLLVVKGLFPAGGHDYFNHYHGYYEAVLRTHGLWPNEVWYQFYYSKGMGLFFLGSLLTDPLAPTLVSYCFAIAAALALFLLVERMSAATSSWPWIAVIAFLLFYVYTPGVDQYRANGGWGDFEKPHEVGAAFVVGFVWLCSGLWNAAGPDRRPWFAAAAACLFIVASIELVTVLLLGLFVALLTAMAVLGRDRARIRAFLAVGAAGAAGLVAVLLVNYLATGLPSDHFAGLAWPWANLRRLAEWGALPYAAGLVHKQQAMGARGMPWLSREFADFGSAVLRLDLLQLLSIEAPLFLALLAGVAVWRRRRPPPRELDITPLWMLCVFFVALAVVAVTAGTKQPISFFRYTSFCLPLVIAFIACGWQYLAATVRIGWLDQALRLVLPPLLLAAALWQFRVAQAPQLRQVLPAALAFAGGSLSIREAYSAQQGWPGRRPYGGIFPGMVEAWHIAGPGTRIHSLHLWAYCMLPHCRSETDFSFVLSPDLPAVLLGPAAAARDILRREGLDYFFYTTAMPLDDLLPFADLFAPGRIADYIGVRWTDGTSYLLTWLGPGVTPLSAEWLAQYGDAVRRLSPDRPNLSMALLRDLRDALQRGTPHWGSELNLSGVGAH